MASTTTFFNPALTSLFPAAFIDSKATVTSFMFAKYARASDLDRSFASAGFELWFCVVWPQPATASRTANAAARRMTPTGRYKIDAMDISPDCRFPRRPHQPFAAEVKHDTKRAADQPRRTIR